MEPYIKSVDNTKSLGKLVFDYGEIKYRNGFLLGFLTGVATSISLYFFLKN
jgi:hypothetical protein